MAKVSTKSKAKAQKVAAVHLEHKDGEHHAVAIWNLSVLIVPDGKFWYAQGLEIDYGAQGDSIEEAKKNFEEGLEATIDLNLKMYGTIKNLLTFAPSEVLQEALRRKDSIKVYWQVSIHEVGSKWQSVLPFDSIRYLVAKEAA